MVGPMIIKKCKTEDQFYSNY